MALYAMSVSASVVSIRYCGTMQGKVIISALESNDCCCADSHNMEMWQGLVKSDIVFNQSSDASAALIGKTDTVTPKACCAEIVLQSRLAANQLINAETISALGRTPQLLPAIILQHITYRPVLLTLHKPIAVSVKPPPPAIPLYKLFQRFTFYG